MMQFSLLRIVEEIIPMGTVSFPCGSQAHLWPTAFIRSELLRAAAGCASACLSILEGQGVGLVCAHFTLATNEHMCVVSMHGSAPQDSNPDDNRRPVGPTLSKLNLQLIHTHVTRICGCI